MIYDEITDTKIYENLIEEQLDIIQEEERINDYTEVNLNKWTYILRLIYERLFKLRPELLHKDNAPNHYDMDKVEVILDYYIYQMCGRYNKIVKAVDFQTLTGISKSQFQEWLLNNDKWHDGKQRLSTRHTDVAQKLKEMREETLFNAGTTARTPLMYMARLNKEFGWNSNDGISLDEKRLATARREDAILPPPKGAIPGICSPDKDNSND